MGFFLRNQAMLFRGQRSYRRAVPASLLCITMLTSGCASDGVPMPSEGEEDLPLTTLHALMSKRLSLEFASLNALASDFYRTEAELDREREFQLTRIGELARRLQGTAETARTLDADTVTDAIPLSENDLRRFRTIAERLEYQAGTLATMAETGDLPLEEAREILVEIDATCDSCHRLYRPTGE